MAKITLEESVEYPTLPNDSILFCKVEEVIIKTVNEGQSNEWKKCEFKFKILGIQHTGDGSPVALYDTLLGEFIYGSTPFRFNSHPENKLRLWTEAILGMQDLGVGFDLDTSDLERRQCRVITSTYTKRNSNIVRHQVESLLPVGNTGPAPLPATPAQVAQEPQMAQSGAADPWAAQPSAGWGATTPVGGWDKPPF